MQVSTDRIRRRILVSTTCDNGWAYAEGANFVRAADDRK
jgi:hypothetical protein